MSDERLIHAVVGLTQEVSCLVAHVRKASECCELVTRNDLHATETRLTALIQASKDFSQEDKEILESALAATKAATIKWERLAKTPPVK